MIVTFFAFFYTFIQKKLYVIEMIILTVITKA